MVISNNFILNADKYYNPIYKVIPFTSRDLQIKHDPNYMTKVDKFISSKLQGKKFCFTESGRSAIGLALSKLNLNKEDCVTILTTTENYYISRCVTDEIDKFCKWSRKIENKTKVILVNHEFGFPYEKLSKLSRLGFPIIEDCAFSFNSDNEEKTVSRIGDFVIYSFTKFFPVQMGGLLAYDSKYNVKRRISSSTEKYVKKIISTYTDSLDSISEKRIKNYLRLSQYFFKLNLSPRFKLNNNNVPGVFMFKTPKDTDLDKMKIFVNSNGIESSVFYGENAFFIPVHQNLEDTDLMYFFEVIKYYIDNEDNK